MVHRWIASVANPATVRMPAGYGAGGGGGNVTIGDIHVHAAPGMDENALTRRIVRTIEGELRRAKRS